MVPNAVTFNILRNNSDDNINLGKTLFMDSTIDGAWIHYAEDRSGSAISSKPNIHSISSHHLSPSHVSPCLLIILFLTHFIS